MSKIRVLAIPSDSHGVGKYRVLDPFKFIGNKHSDEIHVDIVMNLEDNDSVFDNYDVVVFHSFIHMAPHERNLERIEWLKKRGIKVVMDIDDFWNVDQRHPMYEQIKKQNIAEKKVLFLKAADYVTELMKSGIEFIQNQYKDKSQFVLCGFDLRGSVHEIDRATGNVTQRPILPHETVWSKYESIFTSGYKVLEPDHKNFLLSYVQSDYPTMDVPYLRRWTQDINKYALNYNYFDVSLAPLVDSYFNSCKSQLKVIEAGFHKKAIIASENMPYTLDLVSAVDEGKFKDGGNALVVSSRKNHKDWAKHMKRLIDNPNMIEDLGNRLYETVKDKYALKNVCADRVQFLKSIVNK